MEVWDRAAVSRSEAEESVPDRVAQRIGAGRHRRAWGVCERDRLAVPLSLPGRFRTEHGTQEGVFCVHASRVDVVTLMILPQVHLRKPCYDFYFL